MTNEEALQQIDHLVGTRYVPSVKAYVSELTGRDRVVGINDRSTREYDPERIQIEGDADGKIKSFAFN
ncbi:hypothetical protein D3C76_1141740 [compost metagenome]|uniref:Peptidase inhibitor I78 family protein n=1 Tax=Pseudomonas wadenswilerensis TaxID=1785161 RepID=A0A380SU54_9PSED|nr:hypothetical protein [Pseudomonas wadenswilerensis]SUQ60840.1 Peptidase inhibitor I78 family protein [Pseudomonas wadenswilerensis]